MRRTFKSTNQRSNWRKYTFSTVGRGPKIQRPSAVSAPADVSASLVLCNFHAAFHFPVEIHHIQAQP